MNDWRFGQLSKPIEYVMQDLGYERTPANQDAKLRVKFADGKMCDVLVQVVADHRDSFWAIAYEDTIERIHNGSLGPWAIEMWAQYKMSWEDFAPYAVAVQVPDVDPDWSRAKFTVIGEA